MRLGTTVCVATLLLIFARPGKTSEIDKSQLVDLEQKVGKGWQCFAIPNGLGRVGHVFEQRQDKSVFYLDDLNDNATLTSPIAIGSMSTSKQFSVGAAINLIRTFFPSLSVSYERDKKTTIVISGAEETSGGLKVSQDATAWAQKNLKQFRPGSRLFVIREAILASGVTYTFDTTTATAIAAQLSLTEPKTATASSPATSAPPTKTTEPTAGTSPAKQSSTVSPPTSTNQIAQTFDPKIGICIHPDEIVLGNSYGGPVKAMIIPVTEDLGLR